MILSEIMKEKCCVKFMKKLSENKVNSNELLIDTIKKLRNIKLPDKWSVCKLDVTFERDGVSGGYATVIYDYRNDVFYVKTNKCIIYPEDINSVQEGIEIMKRANGIIKYNKNKHEKEI